PVYNVQDWDSAPTAILWPRLVEFLKQIKQTGVIPPDHRSHDHLNDQTLVPVDQDLKDQWTDTFKALNTTQEDTGIEITWGLIDGFLLYWHPVNSPLHSKKTLANGHTGRH